MILVTGAKGVVGQPLVARLAAEKMKFLAVSRQSPCAENQLQWNLDEAPSHETMQLLERQLERQLESVNTLIHCAPIWLLPRHLQLLSNAGITRFIVFSSTSVLSKRASNNQAEQNLVDQLRGSEQALTSFCNANKLDLTILRPSMIYGYQRDQNVSHIANFIKRFGFFVLVGKADGLRQPVHANDLVDACLAVIDKPNTFGKTYNLAGADTLSYRAMVETIFTGLNKTQRILTVPLFLFRPALLLAAKFTRFSYTPEMADRMMQNLNYDYSDASNDFGYQPQPFLENTQRDLA